MKKLIYSFLVLGCILSSCKKEQMIPADCASLANTKIIADEKLVDECVYTSVYQYKGDIYTVLNCCVCDLAYMAFDCEGNTLCDFDDNCMDNFAKKAKYLYSVKDE